MKKIIILAAATLAFSSLSHALTTITCKEDLNPHSLEFLRMRYTIELKETKDISKSIKHVDNAFQVNVSIGREDELGGNQQIIKTFKAISTSEDVYYSMSSIKKNGVKFYLYLDEYDQAGMEIVESDGRRQKVRMTCEE